MTKKVPVVEKIMGANETLAEKNRATLDEHNVFGINLMASPGAGKTSLIEQTLPKLAERYRIAVIDGDIATSIDADRAAEAGADVAVQVNTGGNCHLDAVMLQSGMDEIDFSKLPSMDEILAEHNPTPLPKDIDKEITMILKGAREYYSERGLLY